MRTLVRDAAILVAATLVLGAVANLTRTQRLAWWGQGNQPPQVDVDFRFLDVGSADALRTSLPRVLFLDTRPPEVAAGGRVPGAWSISYTNLTADLTAERLAALQQSDAVVLYGSSDEGDVEQLLAQELHRQGIKPPYVLIGGFPAWEAAGLPSEGGAS
ncbi:MAG: rhodanese-like domain-containing protein [Thermoanaerobaculaceae bacterium]|jgi:3-mercaptopyruvate sulfurtransferase SseA|nr:rhodanese-like domain-containing protein [Thermoanaerobaculaceae bacterium]